MNNLFLGIIALAVLVLAGFVIYLIIDLKKTLASLNRFITMTEDTLQPMVDELQMTLKSVRKITDDVGTVTEDARRMSGSLRDIGDNVQIVSRAVREVATESVTGATALKAGLKAGFAYFMRNIGSRGSDQR